LFLRQFANARRHVAVLHSKTNDTASGYEQWQKPTSELETVWRVAQNKNAADKTSGAKRLMSNDLNRHGQNGFIKCS